MSTIRKYRVDGHNSPEFYYKIQDNNGRVIFNLCLDEEGVYFYKARSSILSSGENQGTRQSYDGYLSMEELKDLFDALKKAGLNFESEDVRRFRIRKQRNTVVIEKTKS